jgi:predicted HTH domain antitoxin
MSTLNIQYNDSILAAWNASRMDFEGEARKALAVKMFEIGRLTSGQAAEMAGVSRVDFLLDCHKLGAFSVQWDNEELASEFPGHTV